MTAEAESGMDDLTDSPRQQLREALRPAVERAIRAAGTPSSWVASDTDEALADILAALDEAGWGPTAAHPDQDSGLTAPQVSSPSSYLQGWNDAKAGRQFGEGCEGWRGDADWPDRIRLAKQEHDR